VAGRRDEQRHRLGERQPWHPRATVVHSDRKRFGLDRMSPTCSRAQIAPTRPPMLMPTWTSRAFAETDSTESYSCDWQQPSSPARCPPGYDPTSRGTAMVPSTRTTFLGQIEFKRHAGTSYSARSAHRRCEYWCQTAAASCNRTARNARRSRKPVRQANAGSSRHQRSVDGFHAAIPRIFRLRLSARMAPCER